MKIAVIGLGYVGLTTALILDNAGNEVIGVEIDDKKRDLIAEGILPFHEPGLQEMMDKCNISLSNDIEKAVELSDYVLVCVGTPSRSDGRVELKYVYSVMMQIGRALKLYPSKVVILKSTCAPGTSRRCIMLLEQYSGLEHGKGFSFIYTPEFLREGTAVSDNINPEKIVVGHQFNDEILHAVEFYSFVPHDVEELMVVTTYENAELIKYANNSFLATKISFINEIANICEQVPNADVKVIARAIGMDSRIGPKFLQAGLGYGGSCFPKDVSALIGFSDEVNRYAAILNEVHATNISQRHWPIEKLREIYGEGLNELKIAVLGLAFKPNTDDTRESPATDIIDILSDYDVEITTYDPIVESNSADVVDAIDGADAAIIVTDWNEFKTIPPETFIKHMKRPIVLDGRRIYDPVKMTKSGVEYYGIGLGKFDA